MGVIVYVDARDNQPPGRRRAPLSRNFGFPHLSTGAGRLTLGGGDGMLTDFAYALRLLGRSPGFTAAVVLSLGLGIGANTAIFTLMDAVMWRMLPVQDPEHLLVAALQQGTDIGGGFNYDDYKILRDASTMARSAGYATAPVNRSVDGRTAASVQ